jgi:hypothetical protein
MPGRNTGGFLIAMRGVQFQFGIFLSTCLVVGFHSFTLIAGRYLSAVAQIRELAGWRLSRLVLAGAGTLHAFQRSPLQVNRGYGSEFGFHSGLSAIKEIVT